MLPGFRFLCAAIVLSLSILVFGLGAAALLRAAHEEVASNPAWHAASRETAFAPSSETARPFLAMLRLEPPAAEKSRVEKPIVEKFSVEKFSVEKPSEDVPAAAAVPLAEPATPAEQAPAAPGEPEKVAALKSDDSMLPGPAKADIPVAAGPAPSEGPPQSAAAPAPADAPASLDETRIAALKETAAPANDTVPAAEAATAVASEPAIPAALPDADDTATNIATLEGPPVTIHLLPRARPAIANPDSSIIKKRLQARRAAKRRRIAAAQARLAQQALLQQQLTANPFFRPAIQQAAQPAPQRAIR